MFYLTRNVMQSENEQLVCCGLVCILLKSLTTLYQD